MAVFLKTNQGTFSAVALGDLLAAVSAGAFIHLVSAPPPSPGADGRRSACLGLPASASNPGIAKPYPPTLNHTRQR